MSKRPPRPANGPDEAPMLKPVICPSSGRCPPHAKHFGCAHRGKHEHRGSCECPCMPPLDWKGSPWCGPCQPFKPPLLVPAALAGRAQAEAADEGGRS